MYQVQNKLDNYICDRIQFALMMARITDSQRGRCSNKHQKRKVNQRENDWYIVAQTLIDVQKFIESM